MGIILIDTREPIEISEALAEIKLPFERKKLEVGDYVIGDLVIERKTIDDFYQSITQRTSQGTIPRLWGQLHSLADVEHKVIVLQGILPSDVPLLSGKETGYYKSKEKAINRAVFTIIYKFKTTVVWVEDKHEFIRFLIMCNDMVRSAGSPISGLKKKPRGITIARQAMLECTPGIGAKVAHRLIDEFETPKEVFEARAERLLSVKGMTKTKLNKLREIYGGSYDQK